MYVHYVFLTGSSFIQVKPAKLCHLNSEDVTELTEGREGEKGNDRGKKGMTEKR
jgi:hypothetical protein